MERISDEKLDRLIKYVLPAIKLSFNNRMEPDLRSALEELEERREADKKVLKEGEE